jgi:hypothetical protein
LKMPNKRRGGGEMGTYGIDWDIINFVLQARIKYFVMLLKQGFFCI